MFIFIVLKNENDKAASQSRPLTRLSFAPRSCVRRADNPLILLGENQAFAVGIRGLLTAVRRQTQEFATR
jgi:hypothetical protein